ncbi:MAG: YkgJ family cysteine cluster protein [Candidatus Gastranaerophilales bacterium]|nr:YkgJ family cysteine cluster protein [Candidatus Gastranaerophilales bacterium]
MSESVKMVEELLKLPQKLCKTCGMCCKIAIFKGELSYEEVKKLANSTTDEISQIDGARDFLSVFVPLDSIEDAKKINKSFVENILKTTKNSNISFFTCKFLDDNNRCKIHEDRPLFCRMYPIPHEKTIYFDDCGFKEKGIENWDKIKQILTDLENKKNS